MSQKRVYYAVLNMGLGHAARSLPIIQEFKRRNWEILVGTNGRALRFLQKELPSVDFIETPNYQIEYSKKSFLTAKLSIQIPRILKRIHKEHLLCEEVVSKFSPDLIFSDHCYGAYHKNICSIFLSHQIYFATPYWLRIFDFIPAQFNFVHHKNFSNLLIPDISNQNGGFISGQLSRLPSNKEGYNYVGILSSFVRKDHFNEDIDVLISISGPEPQRTIFEKIILKQVENIDGKVVVLLGKSEQVTSEKLSKNLEIYSHLPRSEMEDLFNRTKLIVSRPGYTTFMELAELGKKALFIPTPGQTEQLYLARRALEKKWFFSVGQNEINLVHDIEIAKSYPGLFLENSTQKTLQSIWGIIEAHI